MISAMILDSLENIWSRKERSSWDKTLCGAWWLEAPDASKIQRHSFLLFGKSFEKPSLWALVFKYFRQFKEKQGPSTFCHFCSELYHRYNHADAPGSHMWPSPDSGSGSKCVMHNSGSQMFMLWAKTLSEQDLHWRNPRKNNYRERSNTKSRVSVHWRAQCHQKWPRGGREFEHPAGIEPKSLDLLPLTLTTEPYICIDLSKKSVYDLLYLTTWNRFSACRIVVLGLLRLNIKARHDIPKFMNAKLLYIRLITFNIDWSWNIFT